MKHSSEFLYAIALPDAPLAMPKQRLERQKSLMDVVRNAFLVLSWR
ncbi:hypothetical protein N8A98_03030 [Devosia neptuniae]|jgi:hypothetical protein|uniref:Transposase n=1 Tax=Devosia neptuniae TaxID=191302 RepID=A0ABY6CD75_9HYPH|nr:hypothetical protein [Devosia neptuniae]UXN70185.1 hypothetical protein N8A98_03030 [Devosia neptuniae]UXN73517.1 hypothetical protein N8D56_22225 [Devosia sp. A8/3-2]